MAERLDAQAQAALRAPFAPEKIGKLPRVTCIQCRDARSRACDEHKKVQCAECHNFISPRHIHLDYVGHADVTDRLLEVDPEWTWEPMALGPDGLPALDANGGLWIRLTVRGVTRIGYGDAEGKRGGNAVKEAIGDSLRNAAMRFGVALDLWRKDEPIEESRPARRQQPRQEAAVELVTQAQHKRMHALWREIGYGGDEHRNTRLTVTAKILGLPDLTTSATLTSAQAKTVIDALEAKKEELEKAGAA